MEWIPVFSLIVLVATIGTFIMSVSAYVMFKIRERKKQAMAPRRATRIDAEIVAPEMQARAQTVPPRQATPPRSSGQRLVQYTPPAYDQGGQSDNQEPVAWR